MLLQKADDLIFGEPAALHLWSSRLGQNLRQTGLAAGGNVTTRKTDANISISTALSMYSDALKAMDVFDDDEKPLFARAVTKLGPIAPGQAFGFFPALAMGGVPRLENLRIVPALEHFLFLAQLQPFKLIDYLARPPQIVREIG